MARQTKFKPVRTPSGWQLNIPAKYAATGKRERHFYKTQVLALAAAAKLKEDRELFGNNARTITPSLAEAAVAAMSLLEPWGVSLIDAAREVAEARKLSSMSCPVGEAVDAWLASCDQLRARTLKNYRVAAGKLKRLFSDRLCSSVTRDELQVALCPPGSVGAGVMGNVRPAKSWWLFCAKQGWCKPEVFAVNVPKATDAGEISFLSVDEATALLRVAEKHFPQAVGHVAVQLFAGIRREELARLQAEHVTSEGIELGAEITKKGRRRHITPSTTLKAWLEAHPFQSIANWPRVDKAIRRLAGWDIAADLLENPPAPTRGKWPQNCLRHSHATYAIAAGTPLESLEFEFGHVEGGKLLRQHYVGRASKKQAIEYFKIAPKGVEIPQLAIA